ncbi:MAG: hypothetical protein U1D55_08775 [Phycisphaerae bacterium]
MFEHRSNPLIPKRKFYLRLVRVTAIAAAVVWGALGVGILGYHFLEGLTWVDAVLNASMILFGMGPVNSLQTTAGKLFASAYAMFSGIVFVTVVALLFAPLFHRMIHRFHLELADEEESRERANGGVRRTRRDRHGPGD